MTSIWLCGFYLLLLRFDRFVLTNPVQRPAEIACAKYQKIATSLNLQSAQPSQQTTKSVDTVSDEYKAKQGEFPYAALLGFSTKDEKSEKIMYSCAGTLISERHVLTAAHCARDHGERTLVEIVLGTTDLKSMETQGVQHFQISKITKHPEYNEKFAYDDIAIVELKESINSTNEVQPACILTKPLTGKTEGAKNSLVVLGWKSNEGYGKLVKIEKQKLIEKDECSMIYDQPSAKTTIPNGFNDGMICLGKSDETKEPDACWATSAGSLLIPSDKSFLLTGYSSFGFNCNANKPSVMTMVYKYLDWIEGEVWPEGKAV